MLRGAELILVPNACPMEINRLSQLRARAFENMLAIATCNYPAGVPDCNGGSSVFDGVAYLPDMENSRDTCILQADGSEGIFIAELDLEQLRSYREKEVHGNAYRHPRKYGILIDTGRDQPFIRRRSRNRLACGNRLPGGYPGRSRHSGRKCLAKSPIHQRTLRVRLFCG